MITKEIKTYLSVDLDYWGSFRTPRKTVILYIDKILSLGVPIHIVESHEDILIHINNYRIETLINVDFHADICNEDGDRYDLNEGTWANFYFYPNDCRYVWIYPPNKIFKLSSGRCDNILTKSWHSIRTRYNGLSLLKGIDKLPDKYWSTVEEVCISISQEYLSYDMSWLADRYDIFKQYRTKLSRNQIYTY